MKKIFRKRKLQIRFFLAYLTIALLVTGAFSIFFYRYTSQILIRRETKALADLNTSFISAIDQILSDMNTVSVNICYSDQVIGSLDTNLTDSYASFRSLIDTLVSINGIDVKVDQMNIYDFEGTLAQVGIRTAVTAVDIDSLDWIDEVRGLDGGKYLTLNNDRYKEIFGKDFENNEDFYWTSENYTTKYFSWMFHPYTREVLIDPNPHDLERYGLDYKIYAMCVYN